MKKGTKLYSIFRNRCPVCHEGRPFKHGVYSPGFAKMEETCECCGHKYEIENGFFYGAMYVSYALTVAIMVSMIVATYVLVPNPSAGAYIAAVVIGVIVMIPITFRGSRLIWMNFFSKYKGKESLEA
ncbi:MAG: DUF983 domain-containing protein [Crocinitomicaceae bacterium]|nr:DUF983 domain-containing protein [Crocinitomicaceae bacterium]